MNKTDKSLCLHRPHVLEGATDNIQTNKENSQVSSYGAGVRHTHSKCGPLPVFENKVLLEHGHSRVSNIVYRWFHATMAE